MNNEMLNDIKRNGLVTQIVRRLGILENYQRAHDGVDHVHGKDQWSGRLTPTSGEPQANTSVSLGGSVYFSPWNGNEVPLWDGAVFQVTQFTELTLTLNNPNHVASTVYPVFYFNNGTTRTIGTGPAWTSATARGTGAGTGELEMVNGVKVNRFSMTVRNGATTYTVPARYGTHIGDIKISSTVAKINWTVTERGIWNRWNQLPFGLYTCPGYNNNSADNTYAVNSATWVEANGGTGSRLLYVLGEPQSIEFQAQAFISGAGAVGYISIGLDTITSPTGKTRMSAVGVASDVTFTENNSGVPMGIGSRYAALLFANLLAAISVMADEGSARLGASTDPAVTFMEANILL